MPTVELIVSQPGQEARKIEMSKKMVSIGRKPDNTIALEGDTNVSKYHAVIERREDGFWVSDLGSSNGTTVNNQPIKTERKLRGGDLIGVGGSSTIKFQMPEGEQADAAAESQAPAPPAPPSNAPPAPATAAASAEAASGAAAGAANAAAASGAAAPGAAPSADAPAPAASGGISSTLIIAGVVGSLLMVGAIVAILFGTGVIGGASARKKSPLEEKREERARLEAEEKSNAEEGADKGDDSSSTGKENTGDTQASAAKAISQMPDETTGALGAPPPPSGAGGAANTDEMGAMARTLAVQIAQKSAYNFDPAFIAFIRNYVNEYRAAAGYYERARRYRDAVDREFINVQGIQPPLIGYVTAMSRTRFVDGGAGGVWGLPPAVVSSNSPGGAPVNMSDPDASTRVAASYMKDLLDLFERENFMYAVACYGMTMDEAGKVKAELEQKDPGAQLRFDFWKMKNAGVVKGDQVERVARFFAAGIVAENPQRFGLQDRPLSSLY